MKIVKCDLKEYLERFTSLSDEEIEVCCKTIKNEEDLSNYLENGYWNALWSYPIEELDYLLDKEQDNKQEWKEETGNDDYEDTYVLLFGRLWEVEQ